LVAVLDTGVANHQDLDDDVVLELCILKSNTEEGGVPCPDGSGQQLFEEDAALDGQGHGTHVTGIITSAGMTAPLGIAPNAGIVAIKVLDDQDPAGTGQVSDWIKGLEWVLSINPAVDGLHDVKVVNMSLGVANNGFMGNGDCEDPRTSGGLMASAINILRQVGVLTVASSGNDSFNNKISFPSCISTIMSVGATDDNDQIKFFSNSNANLDIVAPGDQITSTGISDSGILTASGTSMASPHVAACAALRVQENPSLTTNQLQMILKNSPVFVTNPNSGLSFPRLWCQPPVLM
jgi:subtilisin family serine protease